MGARYHKDALQSGTSHFTGVDLWLVMMMLGPVSGNAFHFDFFLGKLDFGRSFASQKDKIWIE
jgi:hypothetical protein